MSIAQVENMIINMASYYNNKGFTMDFVWHGGEPMLNEKNYFEQIYELQKRYLHPANITFNNSIQTNLTILNGGHIESFKKGIFSNIGVSIDLFGDQRVDTYGKLSDERVIKNMQKLQDNGIPFGCITVLSQKTLPHLHKIYDFYEQINTSFRILPIYRTSYELQHDGNSVSPAEILEAYKLLFNRWLISESNIQVRPIQDYILNVIRMMNHNDIIKQYYGEREDEILFIINTNGDLFSNANAYTSQYNYGNIFTTPMSEILTSANHTKSKQEGLQRMQATCTKCTYYGFCSGFYMAEATPEQRYYSEDTLQCSIIKPFHDYIYETLRDSDIYDSIASSTFPNATLNMQDVET